MATHPSQMKPPAPAISVFTCGSGLPHQEQQFSSLGSPPFMDGESTSEAAASTIVAEALIAQGSICECTSTSVRPYWESTGSRAISRILPFGTT
jgi:hypothetical protein